MAFGWTILKLPTLNISNDEPEATDTDQWALNHGYISITPTKIDVTDYDLLNSFKI